jgi:hypothetical protein
VEGGVFREMTTPRSLSSALFVSTALAALAVAAPAGADVGACVAAANEGGVLRRDVSKLTTARERLKVCAADDCPTEIKDDCRRLLAEVEASIPTIVAVAEDAAGNTLLDVKLEIDGKGAAERLDGLPISVDAGAHKLVFVRGDERVEATTVLAAGKKNQEVRARFAGLVAPRSAVAPLPPEASRAEAPTRSPEATGTSTWRWVGLGAAGLGLVGLGVGTVFGLRASSLQDDAGCPDNRCRDQESARTLQDARSAGNVSTAFFVAGGLLAAGGVTLYLLAPGASSSTSGRATVPFRAARVTPLPSGAAMVLEGSL